MAAGSKQERRGLALHLDGNWLPPFPDALRAAIQPRTREKRMHSLEDWPGRVPVGGQTFLWIPRLGRIPAISPLAALLKEAV